MEVNAPKRRTSRKKLLTKSFPEDVSRVYSSFSNLLSHTASRKWVSYEWQYDEIDDVFFHRCRTYEMLVNAKFPQLKTRDLTLAEWRFIRGKMFKLSKCRRFSPKFIAEQRVELEKYRYFYRILQENNRHEQLPKLNEFRDGMNGFVPMVDSPQLENNQLFRLFIDVKKLFTTKSGLVAKIREINNGRAEQQRTIVNGNAAPISTISNASAMKVLTKMQECNTQIMDKLNQMFCFQVVKDALLSNGMKRKHITLAFSPAYFQRISSVQLYESQRFYRSDTFISITAVQKFMDTLLMYVLMSIQYEMMLKMLESVEKFAEDVATKQMDVMKTCVPNDIMNYMEIVCRPKFFDILKTLRDLLV